MTCLSRAVGVLTLIATSLVAQNIGGAIQQPSTGSGSGGLTIGTTTISGGCTGCILYGDGTNLQNATGVTRTAAGTLTFATSVVSPMYTGSGAIQLQPGTNSTAAVTVANATGTAYVNFDTTNSRVCIGCTSPTKPLQVNGDAIFQGAQFWNSGQLQYYSNSGVTNIWTIGNNSNTGLLLQALPSSSGVFIIPGVSGTVYVGPGSNNAGGSGTLFIKDQTAVTGATRVLVSLGAADSATTSTFTNAGTSSSAGVIVSGQPATTGQRFACLTTTGQIVSSATACVGT